MEVVICIREQPRLVWVMKQLKSDDAYGMEANASRHKLDDYCFDDDCDDACAPRMCNKNSTFFILKDLLQILI